MHRFWPWPPRRTRHGGLVVPRGHQAGREANLIARRGIDDGLGQVTFTSIFGYLIGLMLGLGHLTSLYVAIALPFSSTIIVVKLLSEKREIDSMHGQIALGFLIAQDLVVVLAMIVNGR